MQISCKYLKNLFLLSSIMGLSLFFSSCFRANIWVEPSGNIIEKQYSTHGIRKIIAGDCFRIILTRGANESLRIEADENIIPYIDYLQQGDVIRCCLRPNIHIRNSHRVNVYVTYTDRFNELDLRGASSGYFTDSIAHINNFESDLSGASYLEGNIFSQNIKIEISGASRAFVLLDAKKIELDLSGASSIRGEAYASTMDIELSGASLAQLEGASTYLEMDLSGSSHFEFLDYTADYVNAELSGASEAYCSINERLDLNASGASTFYYRGNIGFGKLSLSGGSRLQKMN